MNVKFFAKSIEEVLVGLPSLASNFGEKALEHLSGGVQELHAIPLMPAVFPF